MTDRDVEREIEANEQPANDEAIGRADDDDDDAEASRRRLNDEDQRRGE